MELEKRFGLNIFVFILDVFMTFSTIVGGFVLQPGQGLRKIQPGIDGHLSLLILTNNFFGAVRIISSWTYPPEDAYSFFQKFEISDIFNGRGWW